MKMRSRFKDRKMNIQEKLVEDHKERVEEARIEKTYLFPNAYKAIIKKGKKNEKKKLKK